MDESYWDAAELVMGFLEEEGRCEGTIVYHDRAIRQLAAYLDAEGLECTAETVERWLESGRETWSHAKYRDSRAAAHRMIEAMEDGTVGERSFFPEGPKRRDELSGWSLAAVDGFVERTREEFGDAKAVLCDRYATQFMVRAGLADAEPEDLTAEVILAYVGDCGGAKSTRALRLTHVRGLLSYLCGIGDAPAWAPMLASDRFAVHAECYGEVEGLDDEGANPESFLETAEEFVGVLREAGYTTTTVGVASKALKMLYIALSLNDASYTHSGAEAWLEAVSEYRASMAEDYRSVLRKFSKFAESGELDASREPLSPDPMLAFPAWAKDSFVAYAQLRLREGLAEQTVRGDRLAAARLAAFADGAGVSSWSELDAGTVAAWCVDDPHATAIGRAGYIVKARGFLRYLEEEGILAMGVSIAAGPVCAPRRRVVEVLGAADVARAEKARLCASSPMELRDAAMVALGLTMGMRACDVVGLKLSDISWRNSAVTFVQRKTHVQVTLPLTVVAGNAIVAYLRDGRPQSGSPLLFVRHMPPFDGMSPLVCRRAMARTFGPELTRFHTLRKTFATRMLEAGAGRDDVAGALGHSTERSVAPYLSLDAARMRMCALSPAECGIGAPE